MSYFISGMTQVLEGSGLMRYEVSNFANPVSECSQPWKVNLNWLLHRKSVMTTNVDLHALMLFVWMFN